jgi:hypothetical protein
MKMVLKCKNNEFLVTPLKNVLSFMGLVYHSGIPKLWAIAHKNGHKYKNDEFFSFLVNLHGTPKHWVIAHENGPKTQKR